MASNINPYNIDGTFPVANQDNPSQGFRDNFTNIKNNFLAAENEISDLQSKVLVTSALNGQTISNDMAGTQIRRPQLAAWTQTLLDNGVASGLVTLDFNQANFQKLTTGHSVTLSFINWPSSSGSGELGYGVMRVWIRISNSDHTVTLPNNVNIAESSIANTDNNIMYFDTAGDYIFDFSSIDGGENYLISDLTRNRGTFTDPMFYYNTNVNSTVLIGYGPGLSTALKLEAGQDLVSTLGSYNSVCVGNLSQATVAYTQVDTGGLAGYSVTAARGNIQTADFQPVESNDMLGYINSISYTGTGTANAFQQTASITFFATGSNVEYGLGGNIAFFTATDGGNSGNGSNLVQAVGIENDSSTHFYGNVIANNTYVPSSATSAGIPGQISFDSSYIYVCVSPDTWVRAATATW